MRRLVAVLLLTALLLLGLAAPAAAAARVKATGSFTTELFLPTLKTTPVGAHACHLTVEGRLTFEGTLEGTGEGRTTALIFAPCDDVATNPPGAFADVFTSQIAFDGTVDGTPVTADMVWLGKTKAGGAITSVMLVGGDVEGLLRVDAVVGQGGTYRGLVALD